MIAIKGAAMPEDCVACYFESGNRCDLTDKRVESLDRPEWCPLVEITEPKRGRWEKNGEIMMFGDIPVKCSQCGFKTLQDALHRMDYLYCPNCGARMDEVEE